MFADFAALVTARTELALRGDSTDAARVLSVIAAAGVGPVLPIRLLAAALGDGGHRFSGRPDPGQCRGIRGADQSR